MPTSSSNNFGTNAANKTRRLVIGSFLLIFVNFLWVASSELTRYIFHDQNFHRPFMTTYLKTCMFTIYLMGFMFHRPWRDQCLQTVPDSVCNDNEIKGSRGGATTGLSQSHRLSEPEFEPIEVGSDCETEPSLFSDLQPLVEPPELDPENPPDPVPPSRNAISRGVRFHRTHEIRRLPDSEAEAAVLSRLPYELWLRTQRLLLAYRNRLPIRKVARLALQFCFVNGMLRLPYELWLRTQHLLAYRNRLPIRKVARLALQFCFVNGMLRLSYELWLRTQRLLLAYRNRLPIRKVARLALQFCFVWFVGNCAYQEALNYTQASVVNVLSATSALFTLLLAAAFPSCAADRFTLSKLCAVLLSVAGVATVTWVDQGTIEVGLPAGVIFALVGALSYAVYLVFLRRTVDTEDKLDIPMFFGFVGLFCMVLLWPGVYLMNVSGVEPFYPLPNRTQLLYVAVNGLLGTVLSEYLWLWACFLTSSLIATLSLSLTVPLTVVADRILWKENYPWTFYLGTIPIVLAFLAASLLAHYDNWDPVYVGLRRLTQKLLYIPCLMLRCCRRKAPVRLRDLDKEQTEILINS